MGGPVLLNGGQIDADPSERVSLPFLVSAPGKVIVFGEHAVVHGKAAMAAAVSLRAYLHVSEARPAPSPSITLHFIDINLDHTWTISSLPWGAFAAARKATAAAPPTAIDPELVAVLDPHIATVGNDAHAEKRKMLQSAATTFLYLYLLLANETTTPCTFTLRSTIPIGAGLGSSASIQVCLATALLLMNPTPSPASQAVISLPASHAPTASSETILERINALAFLGESIIHGVASGVDNTVATLGKAIIFKRSPVPNQPASITSLTSFPELPLLIVDTQQAKSTLAQVAKVRALLADHPSVVNHILNAIDAITDSARQHVQDSPSADAPSELASLVTLNHALLSALGVSHPRLELLKQLVDDADVGAFKLTGAGGGGCGFVLLRPEFGDALAAAGPRTPDRELDPRHADKLHALEAEIEAAGMRRYETLLGGPGVGVCLRVVGVREFVSAEGEAGLMGLMRGGWRHWRY